MRTVRPSYQSTRARETASLLLPPYGHEVIDALAAGYAVNVRLYANRPDPWRLAKQHRHAFGPASTLVLPLDTDPTAIHWPLVRNLLVNITDLRGDLVRALARALVRDGCRLAYLLDANDSTRNLRVIAKAGTP